MWSSRASLQTVLGLGRRSAQNWKNVGCWKKRLLADHIRDKKLGKTPKSSIQRTFQEPILCPRKFEGFPTLVPLKAENVLIAAIKFVDWGGEGSRTRNRSPPRAGNPPAIQWR